MTGYLRFGKNLANYYTRVHRFIRFTNSTILCYIVYRMLHPHWEGMCDDYNFFVVLFSVDWTVSLHM